MKTCSTCQHWTPNTPPPSHSREGYCSCPALKLVTATGKITIPDDGLTGVIGEDNNNDINDILTGHQFGCIQHQSRPPTRQERLETARKYQALVEESKSATPERFKEIHLEGQLLLERYLSNIPWPVKSRHMCHNPSPWPATAIGVLLIVAIIVYYASTGQIVLLPEGK